MSTPKSISIAWKQTPGPNPYLNNLWWAWIQHPVHVNSTSLCPITNTGGITGQVLDKGGVEFYLGLSGLDTATRQRLEHYRDFNLEALSGEVWIDYWLDAKPEWL